jgi:hypothetical protein
MNPFLCKMIQQTAGDDMDESIARVLDDCIATLIALVQA